MGKARAIVKVYEVARPRPLSVTPFGVRAQFKDECFQRDFLMKFLFARDNASI